MSLSDLLALPTLDVARALLGYRLVRTLPDGRRLVGRIVETEGYTQDDPAFTGWGPTDAGTGLLLPTGRALPLFGPPGRAFFYRAYRYWLFHVVTEDEGRAGCVFIRAVEPLEGLAVMAEHRPAAKREADLANGPGKLTEAFALGPDFQGHALTLPPLRLLPPEVPEASPPERIAISSRIGLKRGVELKRRFFFDGHPCVSPATPSDLVHRQKAPRKALGQR